MSKSFHVTVAAVIERDGRYLMVEEEIDGTLVYNQPAGHLEDGESLVEAVRREVLEETARPFTPQALLGIYRWRHPAKGDTFIRFCFLGSVGEPEPGRALDAEIRQTLWMTAEELAAEPDRLRSPLVLECLHDAQRGQATPLSLLRDIV